MESLEDHIIVL